MISGVVLMQTIINAACGSCQADNCLGCKIQFNNGRERVVINGLTKDIERREVNVFNGKDK